MPRHGDPIDSKADTLVILNPAAGGGRRVRGLAAAVERLPDTSLRRTSRSGDAARLGAEAVRDGVPRVVAAGGDGTVAAVAGALAGSGSRLGIVPLGTGNDLARALGIPLDPQRALRALEGAAERRLDLARLGPPGGDPESSAWMANALVCGFGARLSSRLDARRRRRWGRLAYLRAALGSLGDLRPRVFRLLLDGEPVEREGLMAVVANGPRAGGNLPLAPGARPDDGLLDVLVVPTVSGFRLPLLAVRLLGGRIHRHPDTFRRRARSVTIDAETTAEVDVDGESGSRLPLHAAVVPAAVAVLVPGGQRRPVSRLS